MYHWQLKGWPNFTYSTHMLPDLAIAFAHEFGVVNGLIAGLKKDIKQETFLEILIEEAIKTSEIEGEFVSRVDVMSSLKKNLGIQQVSAVKDKRASGIAILMVELNRSSNLPLSLETICQWHQILMEHNTKINAGIWRQGSEPMQIVSGAYGRELIHYEAPPAVNISKEMEKFIDWFLFPDLKVKDNVSMALLNRLLPICILNPFIHSKMAMGALDGL